jgi:alpha-tubulin suppressor-like RCC1 family protein
MNNELSYFYSLPDDEIFNIALRLNIEDISYYCLYNSKFNKIICNNEWFWKEKFLYDFGDPEYDYVADWKSLYKNHGSVYVFGQNLFRQLGLNKNNQYVSTPTKISNFKFKTISAGARHTAVIDFNNDIYVFGENQYGQLGLGDNYNRHIPTKISFSAFALPDIKFKSIYAAGFRTVAIDFNNDIWVFGNNQFGQLGLGDTQNRVIPTKLPDLKAKSISINASHSIVIDFTDSLWVFGENECGQLGLGDTANRLTPIKIENFKFQFVSAGNCHTAALDFNNEVWVFGYNRHGQLGLGDINNRLTPTKIPSQAFGLPAFRVKLIVAGGYHTVALDFNDEVWTFGYNAYGQLGLGDTINRSTPTQIASGAFGLTKVKSIFAGYYQTMAIDFNNDVWAFGTNVFGQLGFRSSLDILNPKKIPYLKAYDLALGDEHTAAISDYHF